MARQKLAALAVGVVMAVVGGACGGDGEDRPGTVESEGGGSGSGTHSGSASGTGTGSASGTHTGSGTGAKFSETDANTVVHATLENFAIREIPQTVKGAKVYFEVENKGPAPHEFYVIDSGGKTVAELEPIDAGKSANLAAELTPGAYTAECRIQAGEGKTHADLGMKAPFTVQ
jgi:uncharacterized cupredoxin-like copper-binding protein